MPDTLDASRFELPLAALIDATEFARSGEQMGQVPFRAEKSA